MPISEKYSLTLKVPIRVEEIIEVVQGEKVHKEIKAGINPRQAQEDAKTLKATGVV